MVVTFIGKPLVRLVGLPIYTHSKVQRRPRNDQTKKGNLRFAVKQPGHFVALSDLWDILSLHMRSSKCPNRRLHSEPNLFGQWHRSAKECSVSNEPAFRGSIIRCFPSTMPNSITHFREIAERLGTLSSDLKKCTDPARRLDLLRQFRAILAEADRTIIEESEQT